VPMSRQFYPGAFVGFLIIACSGNQPTTGSGDTGLEGIVRRGPIMPVCHEGEPCDAPFSASFEVRTGQHVIARFQSDSTGHFSLKLAAGMYQIVPAPGAPLLGPTQQLHDVTVGADGITHVELVFDTGIR
ncbi:MAG: hypothetical protein ACREL5_04580, partial [Gemmatimonadales bacterium]